jgi:NAD(P)H-nitrite reductase large subunit
MDQKHAAVIGAGHAGVEAARALAQNGIAVTLFGQEPDLPYFRPRIVAVAFGQAQPGECAMHPLEWYAQNGIEIKTGCRVEGLDAARLAIRYGGDERVFDAVVLAPGAGAVMPGFGTGLESAVFPLWTMEDARGIHARMGAGDRHWVIVGGGVIGIEAALRAVDAGCRVSVVEKMPRLMLALAPEASQIILRELERRQIRVFTGVGLTRMAMDNGHVHAVLENGEALDAEGVLVSIGMCRDLALAQAAGLQCAQGIQVDARMRTSASGIWACGDITQGLGNGRCSARVAAAQGKTAGANVAAFLSGRPESECPIHADPFMLRHGGFELCYDGRAAGEGDRVERLDDVPGDVYRALIYQGETLVGVQMAGSAKNFQKYAALIRSPARPG